MAKRYSSEELLNLWEVRRFVCFFFSFLKKPFVQPSSMPKYLEPFGIVSSVQCLQPVTLLPIDERRQFTRSYKGRPKKNSLTGSAGERPPGRLGDRAA